MKTMRNALNITADNHELVKSRIYSASGSDHDHRKNGSIRRHFCIKEETNRERLMYDLRACGITDTDFENLIRENDIFCSG